MLITDLEILALDCQATGANPSKGRLLEIGWAPYRCDKAAGMESTTVVESFLITLQSAMGIPKAVQRITGISETAMADSVPEAQAWGSLLNMADSIAARNHMRQCPTVIHYARFETPFLKDLHEKYAAGTPFPFQIICTHAIAARLLPDLPRRGLRALSGYFGFSAPKLRRSADHVMATLGIWNRLIGLLQDRCDIHTLQQLTEWLACTALPKRTKRQFPMNGDIRRHLPEKPGIYMMKNAEQQVLYVGKAKCLRKRVNSYFGNKTAHAEHILEMLTQAWDLGYCVSDSALEAAILESDAIKRLQPTYNISLQPADRRLIFVDKALTRSSDICDSQCCVGPIPDTQPVDGLIACAPWLFNEAPFPAESAEFIGRRLFSWHMPEDQCLQAGLALFHDKHRRQLEREEALDVLTALGAEVLRRQLAETQTAGSSDETVDDQQGDPSLNERDWTPEAVAEALERMIMHAAFFIRRARWFALLSESCMAWGSAEAPDVLKHAVVFEKGRVLEKFTATGHQPLPLPPGYRRSIYDRRKGFDIATYDRMRVVTTELRRLIGENRTVRLRLWPGSVLNALQLQRVLAWV